jgi:hypothetical protein
MPVLGVAVSGNVRSWELRIQAEAVHLGTLPVVLVNQSDRMVVFLSGLVGASGRTCAWVRQWTR